MFFPNNCIIRGVTFFRFRFTSTLLFYLKIKPTEILFGYSLNYCMIIEDKHEFYWIALNTTATQHTVQLKHKISYENLQLCLILYIFFFQKKKKESSQKVWNDIPHFTNSIWCINIEVKIRTFCFEFCKRILTSLYIIVSFY